MPYTIQEAQALYQTYGTVTIVNGDARFSSVYDDEDDAAKDYPVTIEPWEV